jgi:predicted AAA+ superfamily ATPase
MSDHTSEIQNETETGVSKHGYFVVGESLTNTIARFTSDANGKYKHRDFVKPLIDFCLDNCYNGKVGIVYGLRATGKTVGMLQAAEALTARGYKAAYAHFNYEEAGMKVVTEEIQTLASNGITHFFVDEATYLGGFINLAPDWSDWLVPERGIKIIISGTDSFMLWTARLTSLFHRYVQFSSNWNSYAEYKRVQGKSFEEYKTGGGIFTNELMSDYIQSSVIDNLLHTIDDCVDESNRTNAYTDNLYGMDAAVIYKAVISILKCAVETSIKEHFIKYANQKNISDLGSAVSGWLKKDKQAIKDVVAESLDLYADFKGIHRPKTVIEALISFLVKIGCLVESFLSTNDYKLSKFIFDEESDRKNIYYFSHNKLMSYVVRETIAVIKTIPDINQPEFEAGINQAAEGYINESIVFSHVFLSAAEEEKVFKYRDLAGCEVDIVAINRKAKTLRLIEVKSKDKFSERSVFVDEARHMYDGAVLRNIGIDGSFNITRALVYRGKSRVVSHDGEALLLLNIEEFVQNCADLSAYIDRILANSTHKAQSEQKGNESRHKTRPPLLAALNDAKQEAAEWNRANLKQREEDHHEFEI